MLDKNSIYLYNYSSSNGCFGIDKVGMEAEREIERLLKFAQKKV